MSISNRITWVVISSPESGYHFHYNHDCAVSLSMWVVTTQRRVRSLMKDIHSAKLYFKTTVQSDDMYSPWRGEGNITLDHQFIMSQENIQ